MWQQLVNILAGTLTRETLGSIGRAILASQVRSNFRRAIRDLVEDEIADSLRDYEISQHDIDKHIKGKKSHLKEEIRARFDALLMKD